MKSAARVIDANYGDVRHAEAIVSLLESYATFVAGGRSPLADETRTRLVAELALRPTVRTLLAFVEDEPAGLLIAYEGFSTFACRPLLNICDLMVAPQFRRRGIARQLLTRIEEIAIGAGCCKVSLEVLEGNRIARDLYDALGFRSYDLDPALGRALYLEKKLGLRTCS